MKKLCLLFVGLAAVVGAQAQSVKLAWDAPVNTTPAVTYLLYAHTNVFSDFSSLHSALIKRGVGTNLTANVEDIVPGQWSFTVTAMLDNVESDHSNVVTVQVPPPPRNMRTVVVQYGATLTNFYDTGFFRLKLP